jgi:hypothetical protein
MKPQAVKNLAESCRSCGHRVDVVHDFGPQLPTTGFKEWVHPLILGRCFMCGLHQLQDPMPEWMWHDGGTYLEPEAHLDDLALKIRPLGETVAGATYKDATLVDRLVNLGMRRSWTPDVLIARHVLEHQPDPHSFFRSLKAKHVVIEVPDATGMFEGDRYHFLWERHISYFTPRKIHDFLTKLGIESRVFTYADPLECALIAITGVDGERPNEGAEEFKSSLQETAERVRGRWDVKAGVFGAGHQAASFFNFYGVQPRFVIDENMDKRGKLMPGSGVPIVGAKEFHSIDRCYLALRADNQALIRERYKHVAVEFESLHDLTCAA